MLVASMPIAHSRSIVVADQGVGSNGRVDGVFLAASLKAASLCWGKVPYCCCTRDAHLQPASVAAPGCTHAACMSSAQELLSAAVRATAPGASARASCNPAMPCQRWNGLQCLCNWLAAQ